MTMDFRDFEIVLFQQSSRDCPLIFLVDCLEELCIILLQLKPLLVNIRPLVGV